MRTVYEEQDWAVHTVNHGEQIDLTGRPVIKQECMPVACYIKPDGDVRDEPSLCFIIRTPTGVEIVAQLSARMFTPVIMELERMRNENIKRQKVQ